LGVVGFGDTIAFLPLPRTGRYQSLDHWRGLACLAVLVNHSVWIAGDSGSWTATERWFVALAQRFWLGVPLFFVISGYCIAATVDAHERREKGTLRAYLLRRIRRIFPPYWIVLSAAALVVALIDLLPASPLTSGAEHLFLRPWWYSTWQWVGNVTLTEQWRTNIFGGQKAWFLGQAWTLSYEEQFYLVAALLLWSMPRRFFAGATAVSVIVAGIAVSASRTQFPLQGFFVDGSWLQFYLGVVVYFSINYASGQGRALVCATLALFTILIPVVFGTVTSDVKTVSQSYFVAILFATTLIPLQGIDHITAKAKTLEPLRYAGLMCYSLYLVHLPLNKMVEAGFRWFRMPSSPWLTVPACAAVSIPLAWLFHLKVERRFMVLAGAAGSREAPSLSSR